jgi:phosphatidylserine decarboxylase
MAIAREAFPYLGAGLAVGATALLLGFPWLGGAALALSGFVAFFFRDPPRRIPGEPGVVVSPADGKIVEISGGPGEEPLRVAIFLSLFDVHINRAPLAGRIVRMEHRPGRFLPAQLPRASRLNERNDITLDTPQGTVRVSQIAGVVARRIVCWKQEGDDVTAGERIGLIQFGSRVELVLPPGAVPSVAVGSRVQGGSSVLARMAAGAGAVEGSRDVAAGG